MLRVRYCCRLFLSILLLIGVQGFFYDSEIFFVIIVRVVPYNRFEWKIMRVRFQ